MGFCSHSFRFTRIACYPRGWLILPASERLKQELRTYFLKHVKRKTENGIRIAPWSNLASKMRDAYFVGPDAEVVGVKKADELQHPIDILGHRVFHEEKVWQVVEVKPKEDTTDRSIGYDIEVSDNGGCCEAPCCPDERFADQEENGAGIEGHGEILIRNKKDGSKNEYQYAKMTSAEYNVSRKAWEKKMDSIVKADADEKVSSKSACTPPPRNSALAPPLPEIQPVSLLEQVSFEIQREEFEFGYEKKPVEEESSKDDNITITFMLDQAGENKSVRFFVDGEEEEEQHTQGFSRVTDISVEYRTGHEEENGKTNGKQGLFALNLTGFIDNSRTEDRSTCKMRKIRQTDVDRVVKLWETAKLWNSAIETYTNQIATDRRPSGFERTESVLDSVLTNVDVRKDPEELRIMLLYTQGSEDGFEQLGVRVVEARGLMHGFHENDHLRDKEQPWVEVRLCDEKGEDLLGKDQIFRTRSIKKTIRPYWNEVLTIKAQNQEKGDRTILHSCIELRLRDFEHVLGRSDFFHLLPNTEIGSARIALYRLNLIEGVPQDFWVPVEKGKDVLSNFLDQEMLRDDSFIGKKADQVQQQLVAWLEKLLTMVGQRWEWAVIGDPKMPAPARIYLGSVILIIWEEVKEFILNIVKNIIQVETISYADRDVGGRRGRNEQAKCCSFIREFRAWFLHKN